MRNIALLVVAIAATFTFADHMMRVDWAAQCVRGDAIQCPDRLWWFAKGCETDAECTAVAPVGDFM